MQKKYSVIDIFNNRASIGDVVKLQGWVRTRRDSKAGISFVALHDGSCFDPIQVVAAQTLPNYQTEILHLTAGCSIEVIGELVQSPAAGQAFEVHASAIKLVGTVIDPDTYPISAKRHTLEYLRDYAHLRMRTNTIGAVTRVRHCLAHAVHEFFHANGFFWIHTPIITSSDCEGAGEMFRVTTLDLMNVPHKPDGKIDFAQDFFGRETFLTVSGQLNGEAYCSAMSKIYTFGPTFRAENSNTARHLAEFWMIEPEIAFADLNDLANLAAAMLKNICQVVLHECAREMEFFAQFVDKDCINRLRAIVDHDFARLEYTDAIKHLQNASKKFEYPVHWGVDLQSEHERFLAEELIGRPVIIMNYPKEIKSFYMRQNDDGKTVAAMDVLAPGIGEIIGGSQREERLDKLDQRMDELKLNKDNYWWYRDLRRYGSVPHAGFGLGFERLISYVTGLANVRDVIPFPRTPKHAEY